MDKCLFVYTCMYVYIKIILHIDEYLFIYANMYK
jgi:hypothetical protein